MNFKSIPYKAFLIAFVVFLIGTSAYVIFQNETIFQKTIGKYIVQVKNINGERRIVDQPFEKINNENIIRWDACHYLFIRNHLYDTKIAGGDYIFGFFPLFPVIWKISGLSPVGICILNFFLFSFGLIIIFKALNIELNKIENLLKYMLLLTLPGTVVFNIPYTESVFFITLSIAFYGIVKNKYPFYFVGMFLCSTTRPAAVIIALSLLCKDIFVYMLGSRKDNLLKSIFLDLLPIVAGTLLIGLIQFSYDHTSLFNFYRAQSYWDHHLQIPRNLSDWSLEGFGLNVAVIFLLIPTLVHILVRKAIIKEGRDIDNETALFIFSAFYLVGTFFFILLYQGGNLHSLFRYTLGTPFFFIVTILGYKKFKDLTLNERVGLMVFPLFGALFVYALSSYIQKWGFYSWGFFITFFNYLFLFYISSLSKLQYKIIFIILFIFNIIWNAYMLNCYVNDNWIFA